MRALGCLLAAAVVAFMPTARAQNVTSGAKQIARPCAGCHPAQAQFQPGTPMAHAMEAPSECAILKSHSLLSFRDSGYLYRMERRGDQTMYTVSDGQKSVTVALAWAFGLGRAGQTYVFEMNGILYESRVSYYREIDGLDLTIGAASQKPADIMEAAGRAMGREDVRCFGCHATHASEGAKLTLDTLIPGLQCERCHESAEQHLRGIKRGDPKMAAMKDLRALSTEEMSNFCGQCHRTWDEIAGSGTVGIANIRFQPYRLTNSKCYDSDDSRIRCTACHDPHRELNAVDAGYDGKCQACHGGGKASAHSCKVSNSNCVSCHMPKLELPGSHHNFTDHQIRIVRTNAPYPN